MGREESRGLMGLENLLQAERLFRFFLHPWLMATHFKLFVDMALEKCKITNYFSLPPKKFIKLNEDGDKLACRTTKKSSANAEITAFDKSSIIKPDIGTPPDGTENVIDKPELIPKVNLAWQGRFIEAEHLKLKYGNLFSNNVAGKILQRLETEVEYFTGDLLKVKIFGKWHNIPRKQVSFGDPGLTYKFSGNCIPSLSWTPLMLELKKAVEDAVNYEFNFVLINRYKDGMDYIGEHRDDEKDLLADAPIASLSFGQHRDFIFRHKDARGTHATRTISPVKLELEHGSLLVMYPLTNSYWYHSLPVRKKVHNARVNLTFRRMA